MMKRFKLTLFVAVILSVTVFAGCSGEYEARQIQFTDYPEHETEAAKLYIAKCSGCHAAPLPNIHDVRQWSGVVQRMQMRMANKALQPLNEQELATVIDYLEKHARK